MAADKIQPSRSSGVSQWRCVLGGLLLAILSIAAAAKVDVPAPLGSVRFVPSPERPVGWRGDGSGRYPGATPPSSWERKTNANGYATKGIVWMAPLPNIGVSMPIIVGDRIFLTSEVCDLVCLDKQTGRMLWIRSNSEFEALSAEDRKTNSAYAEKLVPLASDLAKANTDAVDALHAGMSNALASAPSRAVTPRKPALRSFSETT